MSQGNITTLKMILWGMKIKVGQQLSTLIKLKSLMIGT